MFNTTRTMSLFARVPQRKPARARPTHHNRFQSQSLIRTALSYLCKLFGASMEKKTTHKPLSKREVRQEVGKTVQQGVDALVQAYLHTHGHLKPRDDNAFRNAMDAYYASFSTTHATWLTLRSLSYVLTDANNPTSGDFACCESTWVCSPHYFS